MSNDVEIYIINFILGVIGITFQIGFKIKSLSDKAYVANTVFSISSYFKHDLLSILLSFLSVMTAIFFIQDAMSYFEKFKSVNLILKLTFLTLGYAGADIASRLLGRYSSLLNKVIDQKTDIADGKSVK